VIAVAGFYRLNALCSQPTTSNTMICITLQPRCYHQMPAKCKMKTDKPWSWVHPIVKLHSQTVPEHEVPAPRSDIMDALKWVAAATVEVHLMKTHNKEHLSNTDIHSHFNYSNPQNSHKRQGCHSVDLWHQMAAKLN